MAVCGAVSRLGGSDGLMGKVGVTVTGRWCRRPAERKRTQRFLDELELLSRCTARGRRHPRDCVSSRNARRAADDVEIPSSETTDNRPVLQRARPNLARALWDQASMDAKSGRCGKVAKQLPQEQNI